MTTHPGAITTHNTGAFETGHTLNPSVAIAVMLNSADFQCGGSDAEARVDLAPVRIEDKAVASAASMARVRQQLRRLGAGRRTRPALDPRLALAKETFLQGRALRRYRTWLQTRSA